MAAKLIWPAAIRVEAEFIHGNSQGEVYRWLRDEVGIVKSRRECCIYPKHGAAIVGVWDALPHWLKYLNSFGGIKAEQILEWRNSLRAH